MTVRLDVWLDFSSPFCFLLSNNVRLLEQRRGVDVHWRSLLLRRPGMAPLSSATLQILHAEREYAAEMARTDYGLALCPGPIEADTRLAHIATKYAEMHGRAGSFLAAAMNAYWLEARSLADQTVVQELLCASGVRGEIPLDPREAWLLTDGIEVDRELARAYDIHAAPVTVFERRHVVNGMQPCAVLEEICMRLQAETDDDPVDSAMEGLLQSFAERAAASI